MEPSYPLTPQQPQPFMPEEPPKKWFESPATRVIVALTVIVIGSLLFMLFNKITDSGSQPKEARYYGRDGYTREEVKGSIGDPEALVAAANKTAVAYKGTPIVQPCSIVTIDDLHKQNVHLYSSALVGPVEREYFDGQGQGPVDVDDLSLSTLSGNQCTYSAKDEARVTINVFQAPYATKGAIDFEIKKRYDPVSTVGTVQVFKHYKPVAGHYTYLLRVGDTAVLLDIKIAKNAEATQQALLDTAVKNFAAEASAPTGPFKVTYDSPLFKKSYLVACELYGASDVKSTFGTEASPLVIERPATAVGVINFGQTGGNNIEYNYIETDCTRHGLDEGADGKQSIRVSATSYLDAEPAKQDLAFDKKTNSGSPSIKAKIGDEALFDNSNKTNQAIVFRKGRAIVKVTFFDNTEDLSSEEIIQKLTPVAQKIANNLKGF